MPVKIISVGGIQTVVYTRFEQTPDGLVEHIVIDIPKTLDNARYRLLKSWEGERDWKTGEWKALSLGDEPPTLNPA